MNKFSIGLVVFGVIIFFGAPIYYWYQFSYKLNFPLSESQEVWGQMGDFLGGILNPVLTFISVFLLIYSVNCQLHANKTLENQIEIGKKNENLRTFESSFFHLVGCQADIFQNFKVNILENDIKQTVFQDDAVRKIEKATESLLVSKSLEEIKNFYKDLNRQYNLYEILRAFNVIVSLIDDVLTDEKGFSIGDREIYYLRLINVTRFSNLILVCITVQFLDEKAISKKLRGHSDLNAVMKKVGLKFNLYKVSDM